MVEVPRRGALSSSPDLRRASRTSSSPVVNVRWLRNKIVDSRSPVSSNRIRRNWAQTRSRVKSNFEMIAPPWEICLRMRRGIYETSVVLGVGVVSPRP